MRIKKFLGSSLKEAIEKMKTELGSDAIVLSTRVVEDVAGLSHDKVFEVMAGIEDNAIKPEIKPERKVQPVKKEAKDDAINFDDELKKLSEKIFKAKKELNLNFDKNKPKPEKKKKSNYDLSEIRDLLEHRDIDEVNIINILDQLKKYDSFLNDENVDSYAISTISSFIPTSSFEVRKGQRPQTIALVGPTGVGKTTCIAKLAVISKILHNLDIGLVTIDTYRLGAMDQLRIFSEISDIELLVAYEPKDLKKAVEKFKNKDLIFIDTVGRSQKNKGLLNEIKKFLSVVKLDETYLVLNSTSTTKNLIDVARNFKIFNYNGFIFTKLDEAVTYGNILNVVASLNIPVKYLTNGQVIPDDIVSADPEFIANLIYTGKITE